MKDIGEYLKSERKKNGVGLNEASEDMNIDVILLEAIESGNSKAFKDVFALKEALKSYTKYLGLNVNEVMDSFNDFLFEKTSKISLEDIKNASKNKENDKTVRIASPYTKIKPNKYELAPIILIVFILLFISLMVYLVLKITKDDTKIIQELYYIGEKYEFTK